MTGRPRSLVQMLYAFEPDESFQPPLRGPEQQAVLKHGAGGGHEMPGQNGSALRLAELGKTARQVALDHLAPGTGQVGRQPSKQVAQRSLKSQRQPVYEPQQGNSQASHGQGVAGGGGASPGFL